MSGHRSAAREQASAAWCAHRLRGDTDAQNRVLASGLVDIEGVFHALTSVWPDALAEPDRIADELAALALAHDEGSQ